MLQIASVDAPTPFVVSTTNNVLASRVPRNERVQKETTNQSEPQKSWDIALSTPPVDIISPIDMASSTIGITSVDASVPLLKNV